MRIAPQVVLTREQRTKLAVYARGRSTPDRRNVAEAFPLQRFSKRVIAPWLAGKSLKLKTRVGSLWAVWARLAAYWDKLG